MRANSFTTPTHSLIVHTNNAHANSTSRNLPNTLKKISHYAKTASSLLQQPGQVKLGGGGNNLDGES